MAKSLPAKTPRIDPATYLIARRMEVAGVLRPGQALMLAATLPAKQTKATQKGKRK